MGKLDYSLLNRFLEQRVVKPFYEIRMEKLRQLTLNEVLSRKNPYLFKAKNLETAQDLTESILNAFLSSQEETIFGNLLEGFAVYVAEMLYHGFKSSKESVDLEFCREEIYFIVGIKSGPNWGNSDQIKRMVENFLKHKKTISAKKKYKKIIAINGCLYGKDNQPIKNKGTKKEYYKYCGQQFWKFLSGDANLYKDMIVPIGKEAKQRDEPFRELYFAKSNELTRDFLNNFTTKGVIDWDKFIEHVSKKKS